MNKQRYLNLCALVDKQIYLNRRTLARIRDLFTLKQECTTIKYTIKFCKTIYDTYPAFIQALKSIDPRYMLTLSPPTVNCWNNFTYYVGLLKTIDYGNNLEDSYIRNLFLVRKKALFETGNKKGQISLRRYFEERGITLDRL